MSEFQVKRTDLTTARVATGLPANAPLGENEVMIAVDKFAFTANNVTYGVAGDQLGYWKFFPPTNADDTWGTLPVWGFGEITASNAADAPVGERLYGYFPPAANLRITAGRVSKGRITDTSEHRTALPPAYNSYQRVKADPNYNPVTDDARSLLWPLFITSFCLWDSMKDNDWYDAERVIVLSASSKTSIGLGYAMTDDDQAPQVIGVTSDRSLDSLKDLAVFDEVTTYDQITKIDPSIPTVIVDMSGNGAVLGGLHTHLGDMMKKTLNVGITHWQAPQTRKGYILDRCEFFFAPGHIQKRTAEWGADGFAAKSGGFMMKTSMRCMEWLNVKTVDGAEGLNNIFDDVREGRMNFRDGVIVQM